jgi:V/A-type H+-transporting ATPase subunit I
MKRFYMAVPIEYEEATVRKIGEIGAVQLTRWASSERLDKGETAELYRRFSRLHERLNSILTEMPAEEQAKEQVEEVTEPNSDMVRAFLDENEPKIEKTLTAIEKTEIEAKNLGTTEERLRFLETNLLRVDEIGNFKHIFVKAGFLNNATVLKLNAYTDGTSVVHAVKPGRPGENFVTLTGLNEDRPFMETTLKLLNFEEFTFPQGTKPEAKEALTEVRRDITRKEEEAQSLRADLLRARRTFDTLEPYISTALMVQEARGSIPRTERKSLIHGWIPSAKSDILKAQVESVVPKESIYLKLETPHPEEKVPVQLRNKGFLRSFEVFTYLQGVPNYFEVDPTPIYTVLYVVMFGMMFGDMGGGAIFVIIGLLLVRMKKGFLVFSRSATKKLGQIIISSGVLSVFFGLLYGELFLVEVIHPLLLSPLNDISEIIEIALIFGVSQIILGLSLNILNRFRRKEPLRAILSGHGIVGLIFYLSGVMLAIEFIGQMNFDVFLQQAVVPFTVIAVVSLATIFLSPVIETMIERKKAKLSEKVIEGFGEGLETFITFIANSVSYIRLAAFAIAHGALGSAAVIFAASIGIVPSLLLMNIITFFVEGFAAYIQSLRLMYYEFSTKFYVGDGIEYSPLKTPREKKI